MKQQKTNNWQIKKLGEIFNIERGGSPRPIEEYITDDENGINWIKIGDTKGVTKYITKTNEKIKPEGLKKTRMVYEDDFILSNSMSFGRPYIMKTNGCIHDGWLVIRKNEKVDNNYLYYVLTSNQVYVQFSTLAKGSTVKNLNIAAVKEVEIPLPPLETQHAIVSKIEELFSELDKGIAELKTAQQQLKTYRQSVLKSAFEGKLTNENVKDGELPDGWKVVQIKDVASTYGGYAFKSGEFKSQGKYQVLRMGNVRPGIVRYEESPVFLSDVEESILNKSLLKIDDVIITQTGTRKKRDYGFTTLISKNNLLLNQRIAAIRFNEHYSPKFFLYYSWTDTFKDQFFANETGNVGQGNVGMKAVTETLIPFPVIKEQHRIVQEIESRLSVADKMEQSIQESLQKAEALRQSILKKAFCGELV